MRRDYYLDILTPVLYVGFLFGLVPYSLTKDHLFTPAALYSLGLILLVWQSYTKTLSMILTETVTDIYTYGYLLPLLMTLNSVVSLSAWLSVLYRHQMWLVLLQRFKQLDILSVNDNINYTQCIIIQFVGGILLIGFTALYYFSFYFKMVEISWIVALGQSLSTAVNIQLLIEYLTYVSMLKSKFAAINVNLQHIEDKLLHQPVELPNDIMNEPKTVIFVVSCAREGHRQLFNISTHMNHVYGCQLLATLSKDIFLITIILYTISLTILGRADSAGPNLTVFIAVMCLVLIHNTIELILLVFTCSSVVDQVCIKSIVHSNQLYKKQTN